MQIEMKFPLVDEILAPWRWRLGKDYDGYRNHVIRMLNFCISLHPLSDEARQKLLIAGAFHDLGIWSDDTVDYLGPSVALAQKYLREQGLEAWSDEIGDIINFHHKLTAYDGAFELAEVFRQGDLVDFSKGMVKFGLTREYIGRVKSIIPNAGFHKRLLQLSLRQLSRHPLNPLPMMKW